MARKNLLPGVVTDIELTSGNLPQTISHAQPAAGTAPHIGVMGRGAIGAVTRSIEQLKAQGIHEILPDLIDASFITDRLGSSAEDHNTLLASIREHGQQVPVLVRPHPELEGRYQIAYGRRRLKALAELGRPVRAIVKALTDEQLVVAQGQENSARTDLSFIEKALFAAKLEEAGFKRETIMAALSVDKTSLSRLISSVMKIPRDIIEAIGPAPHAGRDRWVELAARLDAKASIDRAREQISHEEFAHKESDARFIAVFNAAAEKRSATPRATVWKAEDGTPVAQIKDDAKHVTLAIDKKVAADFGAYLIETLPEIYAAFKRRADPEN